VYVHLNARGVPAPAGGRWSRQGLLALMRSARLFGWRDYEGELTAQGDWRAIISEADGRALRALFDRPANTSSRRRHLLSGLLRCGRCGCPMRAGRTSSRGVLRSGVARPASRSRLGPDDAMKGAGLPAVDAPRRPRLRARSRLQGGLGPHQQARYNEPDASWLDAAEDLVGLPRIRGAGR